MDRLMKKIYSMILKTKVMRNLHFVNQVFIRQFLIEHVEIISLEVVWKKMIKKVQCIQAI